MGWSLLVAGIIATVSGIVGAIDYDKEYKETQTEIDKQKDDLRDQYWLAQEELNTNYYFAKEEANKKADRMNENADIQDKILDTEEKTASNNFNMGVSELQLEQENNVFSWNNALASIGANEGNELAAIANNGIRAGSSLSQAVELEAAANSAQLSLEMNNADKQQKWTLQNLYSQNKQAQTGIWKGRVKADQNRFDALDLRNSYEYGGSKWWENQYKLDELKLNYNQQKDKLTRLYNKNTNNYGWGIISSILTAGNKGFESGLNLYNTASNGGKYNG